MPQTLAYTCDSFNAVAVPAPLRRYQRLLPLGFLRLAPPFLLGWFFLGWVRTCSEEPTEAAAASPVFFAAPTLTLAGTFLGLALS